VLQTSLSSFARDPITGAAPDVVVVFKGGIGTMVELAYAALKNRPIIFCDSVDTLRDQQGEVQLKSKLNEAIAGYPLIATSQNQLIEALILTFTTYPQRAVVTLAKEAITHALRLTDCIDLSQNTNFLGLPGYPHFKTTFEQMVLALSTLQPGTDFP